MRATIYVIPGSTSSMAGRLMLEHKGISYRRRDLVAVGGKCVWWASFDTQAEALEAVGLSAQDAHADS